MFLAQIARKQIGTAMVRAVCLHEPHEDKLLRLTPSTVCGSQI